MRRTALGFILTIAVGVGLGAFSAVVVARDDDLRPCADAELNQAFQDLLESQRELLGDFPAQYSDFLVQTLSENGETVRYEFDPPPTSLLNLDLHLTALAECAAGGRASRDGPSIVVLEVGPVGCDSADENKQFRDLLEHSRELLISGASSEASSEMAGNSLDESDQALSLQFIDEELARLAACTPES